MFPLLFVNCADLEKSFFDHDLLFPTLKMRTFLRGGHREVERHLMNICIFHLSNVKSIHVFSRDVDADESGKSEWVDKHEFIWVVSRRVLPYFRIRRLVLYSPFFVSDFQHHVGPFCSHKKLRITTLFTAVKCRLSLEGKK